MSSKAAEKWPKKKCLEEDKREKSYVVSIQEVWAGDMLIK